MNAEANLHKHKIQNAIFRTVFDLQIENGCRELNLKFASWIPLCYWDAVIFHCGSSTSDRVWLSSLSVRVGVKASASSVNQQICSLRIYCSVSFLQSQSLSSSYCRYGIRHRVDSSNASDNLVEMYIRRICWFLKWFKPYKHNMIAIL